MVVSEWTDVFGRAASTNPKQVDFLIKLILLISKYILQIYLYGVSFLTWKR